MKLTYKLNERMSIIGKTGSGKSFFARALCQHIPRLIVMDTKGRLVPGQDEGDGWNLKPYKDNLRALRNGDEVRLRIPPGEADELEAQLVEILRLRVGCVVYIDEMMEVGPSIKSSALKRFYTQGRSLGFGMIMSSQRPFGIPQVALTEAEWLVMFRVQSMYDRAPLVYLLGDDTWVPLKGHAFLIKNQEWDRPVYCPGLKWLRADGTPVVGEKETASEH